MKTSKVIKNQQNPQPKDKLSLTCLKCIDHCERQGCITPCISYEHGNRQRMITECPLTRDLQSDIFNNLAHEVRREMAKRGDK